MFLGVPGVFFEGGGAEPPSAQTIVRFSIQSGDLLPETVPVSCGLFKREHMGLSVFKRIEIYCSLHPVNLRLRLPLEPHGWRDASAVDPGVLLERVDELVFILI